MSLLGLDLGTTHCKGALFAEDGALLHAVSVPTPACSLPGGHTEYDPEELWSAATKLMRELAEVSAGGPPDVIGVAGMAESGCLVDVRSGRPRSNILAWFDTRSRPQAERLAASPGSETLFGRTGLNPSFKHGLAKLLWLRDRVGTSPSESLWLSVPDWIVLRLTGRMVTDPTLAVRTLAFNIGRGEWDADTLAEVKLSRTTFPEVIPSGTPAGGLIPDAAAVVRLPVGVPVAVCGHDHICALLAAGVVEPGPVLDSMGTAESLIGVLDELRVDRLAADSGLSIVPHVLPNRFCWLGGISASGGSVEWLRAQIGLAGSYDDMLDLLGDAEPDPTGILYFPYLAGSGAPNPDQDVRAALVGLAAEDTGSRLLKAVIEGTCFEAETIRRAGEQLTGRPHSDLIAVGGGAKNHVWLQIKADVTGCACRAPELPEATALGAALTAGLGAGLLRDLEAVQSIAGAAARVGSTFSPDVGRHHTYRRLLEEDYLRLQAPLRAYVRRATHAPGSG